MNYNSWIWIVYMFLCCLFKLCTLSPSLNPSVSKGIWNIQGTWLGSHLLTELFSFPICSDFSPFQADTRKLANRKTGLQWKDVRMNSSFTEPGFPLKVWFCTTGVTGWIFVVWGYFDCFGCQLLTISMLSINCSVFHDSNYHDNFMKMNQFEEW